MISGRPSRTAEVVCLMRASERLRPADSRVLDDPYAELFLGAASRATLAALRSGRWLRGGAPFSPALANWIVSRHRWIDERLERALAGPIEQVLILGAGYDTRAYRFAPRLAGRRVYEVDHPATARRKARLVEANRDRLPPAAVVRVEIDFERETLSERLDAAGFATGAPTFVVWEGVSMYLTREAVKSALRAARDVVGLDSELTADFWFLVDTGGIRASLERIAANLMAIVGEPLTFAIHPEDVGGLLERAGWRLETLADGAEVRARVLGDRRPMQPGIYVLTARPLPGVREAPPVG